jgi:hypothetical protein
MAVNYALPANTCATLIAVLEGTVGAAAKGGSYPYKTLNGEQAKDV